MKKFLCFLCVAAVVAACHEGSGTQSNKVHKALKAQTPRPINILIPWGTGEGEVGFRPKGNEVTSEGPWSIALKPDGDVLILDSIGGKVLGITPSGKTYTAAQVDWHARDVAAGPDGTLAVWSPVRDEVYVFSNSVESVMPVPKNLVMVRGIELSLSKTVLLHTAYQERFILGSPSAPVPWPQILYTKMEGEYAWDAGSGIQVILNEEFHPVLVEIKNRREQESKKAASTLLWEIEQAVSSARIMGTSSSGIACLKFETIVSENPVGVKREIWCGRPATKQVLLHESMPDRPMYTSLKEAYLSWDIPVLAVMRPEKQGLRVKTFVFDVEGEVAP